MKTQQVRAFEISEVNFAQRRAHQPRLRADRNVADLSFQFRFRDEGGDGIEHDDVERVRTHERLANAKRFFTGARLRDEQIVQVHAEPPGVLRIERVFDIDERRKSAALLRLGDDGERERGFARRFRSENLHHAAARKSAHAERAIDQDIAGGNDVDVDNGSIAETHDRAVAEIFRDLLDRQIEVLVAGGSNFVFASFFFVFRGHKESSLRTAAVEVRQAEKLRKGVGK